MGTLDLIQMLLVGLLHFLCKQNIQNLCTVVKIRFSSFEYNLQGRRDVHQPIKLQKITLKLRDCCFDTVSDNVMFRNCYISDSRFGDSTHLVVGGTHLAVHFA